MAPVIYLNEHGDLIEVADNGVSINHTKLDQRMHFDKGSFCGDVVTEASLGLGVSEALIKEKLQRGERIQWGV